MNLDGSRTVDIRNMLIALGENPARDGLKDTPGRVLRAWSKLCEGYKQDPKDYATTFSSEGYDSMVSVGPVNFFSTCEHHLLPFFGDVWVAYIPGKKIIGLSKLPRIVNTFARRLQNQERMTSQIVECIVDLLKPRGAACLVRGQHLCMMARGVEQQKAAMTTSALRGVFLKDSAARAEFMSLSETK